MNDSGQINRSVPLGVLSSKGFTLVELIIVMALFMGVIIISSQAFNKILSVSTQQTKSSESDTQGVIGLEMLRVDLEHAGYGLPWVLSFPAEFDEVQGAFGWYAPGINSEQFNDKNNTASDTNKVPRAIQAATSTTDGRDYLAIKSTLVGINDTVKKWAFIEGVDTASRIKSWDSNNFEHDEQVVTIDSRTKRLVGANPPANNLSYVSTTPGDFSYALTAAMVSPPPPTSAPPAAFQPKQDTDVFVVYGVSPSTNLRAPYNRVDYFVKRPTSDSDMPTRCARGTGGKPGTGILYKAVMNHGGGGLTRYPLVECIADMQVVFNVAADGINGVDVDQSGLTGLTAKEIRQQLKMIKIYIVAHEGGKDTSFNYANQTLVVGEGSGRTLDLKNDVVGSDDYKYYRWKTYKLVVIPRNINY
jgi:hypothetical protein